MPILDLQRRHSTTFRLRIGEKVIDSNGKARPVRLTDSIRVTSSNPAIVDAFVAQYGGERRAWEGQWEAKLPTSSLPIMLLPGQSIDAWWEFWTGAVCARRCDGYDQTTGEPCVCPSDTTARMTDKNACRPTTRLSVLCPEVEVLGAGMLVTHGEIAARELPSSVAVAEAVLARGGYVPAQLVIEEHVGPGKKYVVPVIHNVGVSMAQLQSGEFSHSSLAAPQRAELTQGGGGGDAPALATVGAKMERIRANLDTLPDDLLAELRPEWMAVPLPKPGAPGWSDEQAEAALSLMAPYMERHHFQERIVAALDAAYGDDSEAIDRCLSTLATLPVVGTEDELSRVTTYIEENN